MMHNIEFTKLFNELSVAQNGSWIQSLSSIDLLDDVLFVGLGGLGLRTICDIKKIYIRDYKTSRKRVEFLGVDSDVRDLDLCIKNGLLDEEECFYISGTEQCCYKTRKAIRALMVESENYKQILKVLSNKINKFPNHVNVFLISGSSGNTGSAILIDIAQMLNSFFSRISLRAVLYMPNIHDFIQHISPQQKTYMHANRYATFKELDYLMKPNTGTTYNSKIGNMEATDIQFTNSIFAEGKVFLVPPSKCNEKLNDITTHTAKSILFMFGSVARMMNFRSRKYDSTFLANYEKPIFLNCCYSLLNYSYVAFPVNEIIAYCTNHHIERLIKFWKENDITEEEIKYVFHKYHIDSNQSFADCIFRLLNLGEMFEVEKSELPIDGFGPLKVKNCEYYLDLMHSIAEQEGTTQRAKGLLKIARQKKNATFVDPIISFVDKALQDYTKGPLYAFNLMSSNSKNKFGILEQMNNLIENHSNDVKMWLNKLERRYIQLKFKAKNYDCRLSMNAVELNSFTHDCRDYGEELLKCKLLLCFDGYLIDIYNELAKKYNQNYCVCRCILEGIADTLNKDSEYFLEDYQYEKSFLFDLSKETIRKYLDSFIDSRDLFNDVKNFNFMILGRLNELLEPEEVSVETQIKLNQTFGSSLIYDEFPKHKDLNESNLLCLIREYVGSLFKNIDFNEVFENIFILSYADDKGDQISLPMLEAIHNSDEDTNLNSYKCNALNFAAKKIALMLESEKNLKYDYEKKLDNGYQFCLPNRFKKINQLVLNEFSKRNVIADYECAVEYDDGYIIHSADLFTSLALPMFESFKEFYFEYLQMENRTCEAESVHVNEEIRWCLPEMFGFDTVKYFSNLFNEDLSHVDIAKDKELYIIIHKAVNVLLDKGLIFYDNDANRFNMIVDISSTDEFETLKNYCNGNLKENTKISMFDSIKEIRNKTNTVSYNVLCFECGNIYLLSKPREQMKHENKITNLDRIIRNDIKYTKLILTYYTKINARENVFWNEIVPLF